MSHETLTKKGRQTTKVTISLGRRFMMFWVHHVQQALGSLGELSRNPWSSFMTIAVLGFSLTLPSTLYVIVKNSQAATQGIEQAAEINLFLKKELTPQEAATFSKRVELRDDVAEVLLIDKAAGLQAFKETSGFGSALDYLDKNPLPDVLKVLPKPEYQSSRAAQQLLQSLEKEREVGMASLDLGWLERLQALLSLIKNVLGSFAFILCAAVVLIVGNTIRLMILNRREEIIVMKLVGATDAYIQRPFLYTGFWYGFFGGLLAWVTTSLLVVWIRHAVKKLTQLYESDFSLSGLVFSEFMALGAVAIGLGLIGSFMAVRRHVASIEPQ